MCAWGGGTFHPKERGQQFPFFIADVLFVRSRDLFHGLLQHLRPHPCLCLCRQKGAVVSARPGGGGCPATAQPSQQTTCTAYDPQTTVLLHFSFGALHPDLPVAPALALPDRSAPALIPNPSRGAECSPSSAQAATTAPAVADVSPLSLPSASVFPRQEIGGYWQNPRHTQCTEICLEGVR